MIYSFKTQLAKGKAQEARLDKFFSRWFEIAPATREQQRQGIDRLWTGKQHGQHLSVEYKADWTASGTGNVWLEVETAGGAGWMLKCRASHLVYFLPESGMAFLAETQTLKEKLPGWAQKFPVRQAQDDGWVSVGLLVPVKEFSQASELALLVEIVDESEEDGGLRGDGTGDGGRAEMAREKDAGATTGQAGGRDGEAEHDD
jgi:hypothetical protein